MRDKGCSQFVADIDPGDISEHSVMGAALTSGYIQRGDAVMPRQGLHGPWKSLNDYMRDARYLRSAPIDDGVLRFAKGAAATRRAG